MPELAESGYDLGPAEEFFDLLAILHALLVGVMPRGTTVNCRAFLLAGNMRRSFEFPHVLDKVGGVIAFVGSNGDALCPVALLPFHHLFGRLTFGMAIGLGYRNLSDKAVVVLAHGMSHDAELGGCSLALLVQPGVWISC